MSNIDELLKIINYCGIKDIINLSYGNRILYEILINDNIWSDILLRDYGLKSKNSRKKYMEQHIKKLEIHRYIIEKIGNEFVDKDTIDYLTQYIMYCDFDDNYMLLLNYIIGLIEDYNVIFHTDNDTISKNIIEDILSDIGNIDKDCICNIPLY